ncbi:MAG TPA: CARDB domain-containing protein [Solirubrobacterales bacterium]|nr:CARDB domain-containing protein [Solirubrobacterales bacterium]
MALAALVAIVSFSAMTGAAQAANYNYTLDRGVIQLSTTWAKIVDPDLSDPPARLSAEVAGDGTLTAPKENFSFPNKTIEDLATGEPLLPMVDAKIAIAANGNITGNLNAATGVSTVSIPTKATITVYPANSASSVARCGVSGFSLGLSTTGELNDPGDPGATPPRPATDYEAAPFAPPSFDGALVATWAGLPASVAEAGSLAGLVCPAVDGLIGGPGGIWLEGDAKEGTPPIPKKPLAPKILTGPDATTDSNSATFTYEKNAAEPTTITGFDCKIESTDWAPCDSGSKTYAGVQPGTHTFSVRAKNIDGDGAVSTRDWTVTGGPGTCATDPSLCGKIGVKVSPKSKTVKRGKKATFTAKVTNSGGGAAAGSKVCLTAPKKFVGGAKCVSTGNLAAGKSKSVKFKVTVKKKAKKGKKISLSFKASSTDAGSASAKATVKVK